MSNEAAQRLLTTIALNIDADLSASRRLLDDALAAERKATVERMAADVEERIRSGAYLTYHAGPANLVRDASEAILDTEEALTIHSAAYTRP